MISPLFLTLLIILIIFSKSHDNHHFDHTDHNSTSMHDEYKKVCGWTWQQDFIAQQELIRNGQLSPKFIIAIPTDYGFADLVHGYVAAFVIALATNRAFLIAHVIDGAYAQNSIAFGYHSPYINWTSPEVNKQVYQCLLPPYNSLNKCNYTQYNFTHMKKNPCNKSTSIFTHENRDSPMMTREALYQVDCYYTDFNNVNLHTFRGHDKDVVVMSSNRGITLKMLRNDNHKEFRHVFNFTDHTAFPCIFNFLFRMNHDACDEDCRLVERRLRESEKDPLSLSIAVQLRWKENGVRDFFACTDSLLRAYKGLGYSKFLILVVTAYVDFQTAFLKKYGDMVLLPSGTPKHPEFHAHDRKGDRHKSSKDKQEALDRQAMLDSARDLHLLSVTDVQVLSGNSGFGIVGAMQKLTNRHVMHRIHHSTRLRDCGANLEGDSPSVFEGWSSL